MRSNANDRSTLRSGAPLALCLALLVAVPAHAQLVVDGNLFFNNNASVTLTGQATGGPTGAAAIAACPAGYNAAALLTSTFTHNFYGDPLLHNCVWPNGNPNFQPALGSPA